MNTLRAIARSCWRRIRTAGGLAILLSFSLGAAPAAAQPVRPYDGAQIRKAMERLTILGNILYVAAHPDDENTAALAFFANGRNVRTGYLAVTRGDGGQNLIGPEQAEMLGLVRTQELLAARRIDGAMQFFTRAIDFGYSKNPEETFDVWGHDQILSDVVRVYRTFRPDVVITGFSSSGGGHGNHTASAILAEEAFAISGDPTRFPDQLDVLEPWQPTRIVRNNRRGGGPVSIDTGAYDPVLGTSYSELAAMSRSQHKSQGFGVGTRRGAAPSGFGHVAGEPAARDIFDGVDLTWNRVRGGRAVGVILERALETFRIDRPAESVPILLDALRALDRLEDSYWKRVKRAELLEVMRACSGLWMDALTSEPIISPGARIEARLSAVNRSPLTMQLVSYSFSTGGQVVASDSDLSYNDPFSETAYLEVPAGAAYSQAYWLEMDHPVGRYEATDPHLIGRPENPPAVTARFTLLVDGQRLEYDIPVQYRWVDPVEGERYRDVQIGPRAVLKMDRDLAISTDGRARSVGVTVRTLADEVQGTLRLEASDGWRVEPESQAADLGLQGAESRYEFRVTPTGSGPSKGTLRAVLESPGPGGLVERLDRGMVTVEYPHIPIQTLFPRAEIPLVRADVVTRGRRIGYIMGPGDQVASALGEMGSGVTMLTDEDIASSDLAPFDAIVTGVRAFNTRPRLGDLMPQLIRYAEGGGTLLFQYNTTADLSTDSPGPWPLRIGRDRVTVEEAPVEILNPDHPLMTTPNRITQADFEGWVQERGLYFMDSWDTRYEAVLASHDPGEEPLHGGLLFGRVGEGVFVYTSYAFFRQLPAGVPGAWRLFANLIAGGRAP